MVRGGTNSPTVVVVKGGSSPRAIEGWDQLSGAKVTGVVTQAKDISTDPSCSRAMNPNKALGPQYRTSEW